MQHAATPNASAPALNPPKVELGHISQQWPYAILALALMTLIYMVGADEGAAAVVPGTIVHEFVHDGRHLLGFPCH